MSEYTLVSRQSIAPLARGLRASHTSAATTALPQQVSPGADPIACPQCGAIDQPVIGPGSGPHYASARCRHCGAFIRWVSQYSPAERQSRRQQARQQALAAQPPSPAQLSYLQILGDDGPPPASIAEASERIGALRRGEVQR